MKRPWLPALAGLLLCTSATIPAHAQKGGVAPTCSTKTPPMCTNVDTIPTPDFSIEPTRGTTNGPLSRAAGSPYFVDAAGQGVYLTGSHTWNNAQDWGDCRSNFNYTAYLDMLTSCGHNFIRLWAWEAPSIGNDGGSFNPNINPMPWVRESGGGMSGSSQRFDLLGNPVTVNPAYLSRLQARVAAAKQRGVYVGVMLFQGWSVQQKANGLNPWPSHPFAANNNNAGLDADSNANGRGEELHHTPLNSQIDRRQKDYIRAVWNALKNYDNVLWEVANESDSGANGWQNGVVSYLRSLDSVHPIGRTSFGFGNSNANLRSSGADWISPAVAGGENYAFNPPANLGGQVIISDTDHIQGVLSSNAATHRQWIWKNITRGIQSIVMDPVANMFSAGFADETNPFDSRWPIIRRYLGQASTFARQMDLHHATPLNASTCSNYCLGVADPGQPYRQYLIYTDNATSLDLILAAGTYEGSWFNTVTGDAVPVTIQSNGSVESLNSPYPDAALFLDRDPTVVELLSSYVPHYGQPRTTFTSTSTVPPQQNLFFDRNLGTFEQRPGGSCAGGSENPTYLKIGVNASATIDGCSFEASWNSAPTTCPAAAVALLNSGGEITIDTDDRATSVGNGCLDIWPPQPKVVVGVANWVQVNVEIDGEIYPRRFNFRQTAETLHVVENDGFPGAEVEDVFVNQANPNNHHGGHAKLRARHNNGMIKYSFLRFDVPPQYPFSFNTSAQLQLSVLTAVPSNLELHNLCGDNWVESDLTWNNWIAVTNGSCGVFDNVSNLASGQRVRVDVTSEILPGPGFWSIGLANSVDTSTDFVAVSSEGIAGQRPKLVIVSQRSFP